MLKDREKKVAKGLADAESAAKALEAADSEKDKILAHATIEAEKIIDETKKNAESLRVELLEKSRSDAQKIISEGKTAAVIEMKKAEERVHDMALEVSKRVLSKILDELFTKQEKEKILARDIEKLTKYE